MTVERWDRLATPAPERLARAAADLARLREERGIILIPVRHHSPACAVAVRAAIEEVRPAAVLVEGPEEYTALLPALLDERTVPPVAVLSLEGSGSGPSGFYPLARFSPEWVALRAGNEVGADLAFIDRPWGERERAEPAPSDDGEDPFAHTLMGERYLAHSQTVAAMAARLGCRDHDELWDHLFETRPSGELLHWRNLFEDVFAWAALSRLDYEDQVLAAEGSLDREARMAARAAEHAAHGDGPVVVVTGAFHTLAIIEALVGAPEGEMVRERQPAAGYGELATAEAWLVRYDHERLDGLRGYGAGMPSPGFYERLFASHEQSLAGHSIGTLSTEVLIDVAAAAASRDHTVSVAETMAAAEHAVRLAALRERPRPSRTDVLDAITSCLVKDDSVAVGPAERPLGLAVAEIFGGRALGQLPPGSVSPPLVRDARARVERARLDVTDSVPRVARLDARRNPAHRERRQVLALMAYVGSGFAKQLTGPDYIAGRGLGTLLEEWEYAWTPLVEAALVESGHLGATLDAAALARLRAAESELSAESRSADAVAALIAQAVVIGLTDHLPRLSALLRSTLDVDPALASVVAGLHRLHHLWRARGELDIGNDADEILSLLDHGLAAAAYLVPDLGAVTAADEDAAVATIVSLRTLLRDTERTDAAGRALTRLRIDEDAAPGVRGALQALAFVDGVLSEAEFVTAARARLATGADPEQSTRYLGGMMRAAPDLLLHTPELFDAVDDGLRAMDSEGFVAVLPDLRRMFTWLKPSETGRLAERVAARTGARAEQLDVHVSLTEADLARGLAAEQALVAVLARDGLSHWLAPDEAASRRPAENVTAENVAAEPVATKKRAIDQEAARRWRLVLGRYSQDALPVQADDGGLERALSYLYDREYTGRGHQLGGGRGRGGSLDPSALRALDWLGTAGELFPKATFERMQVDAIGRYGLTEVLGDPGAVEALEPSRELATALLQVRGKLDERSAAGMRRVIAKVVEDVVRRLRPRFVTAVGGRIDRSRRSMHRVARNFDWKRTLRANLSHYSPEHQRLLIHDVRFSARAKRSLTWDVVVLVDQSGSMAASLLYSAVCAGILTGLPGINVRLVLFDTSIVDMSHLAHDPVEVLLTAQLGGGTNIAKAVRYAEQEIRNPSRTVVALVSDFEEGGSVSELLATVRRLKSSGVRLLGLAALDEAAEPAYDRGTARRLAEAGMEIAALTPERFAEWLGEVLS
nr:DUF5682 family protein [Nocardioides albus]